MSDEHQNRAWLHRRGRPTWMFEPSAKYGLLVHATALGTIYAIIAEPMHCKPFWIGRLCDSIDGQSQFLATCESELRARSIEFEGAGTYTF